MLTVRDAGLLGKRRRQQIEGCRGHAMAVSVGDACVVLDDQRTVSFSYHVKTHWPMKMAFVQDQKTRPRYEFDRVRERPGAPFAIVGTQLHGFVLQSHAFARGIVSGDGVNPKVPADASSAFI